jgi:hypothetical protein
MTKTLFLLMLGIFMVVCPAFSEDGGASIQPIPEAQLEISRTLDLLNTPDYGREGEAPIDSYKRVVSDLMKSKVVSSDQMLLQIALAYANEENGNGDAMRLMQIRVLLGHAIVEMSPEEIVNALVPYYEQVENTQLEQVLEGLLDMATIRESRLHPDLKYCVDYLESRKSNPPQKFVKYMYTKSPEEALSSVTSVYLDKDEAKTLVDQVQSEDEAQAVDRLSKRPEWWAKLYAAEKMKQNHKLRDPELMKQLKKSNDPVVSATIQEIEDEKK